MERSGIPDGLGWCEARILRLMDRSKLPKPVHQTNIDQSFILTEHRTDSTWNSAFRRSKYTQSGFNWSFRKPINSRVRKIYNSLYIVIRVVLILRVSHQGLYIICLIGIIAFLFLSLVVCCFISETPQQLCSWGVTQKWRTTRSITPAVAFLTTMVDQPVPNNVNLLQTIITCFRSINLTGNEASSTTQLEVNYRAAFVLGEFELGRQLMLISE